MKKFGIYSSIFVCAMLLSVTMFPGVLATYTGTKFIGDLGTTNLVSHWDLDSPDIGEQIVTDIAGNNDGVCGDTSSPEADDATYDASTVKLGISSLFFDPGWGDKATIPDNDTLDFGADDNFSIFCWVNADTNNRPILAKWSSGKGYKMTISASNDLVVTVSTGFVPITATGITDIVGDGWHHVGLVRENSVLTAWVDGTAEGWALSAGVDLITSANLMFGTDGTSYYDGNIDDVRVYNAAINPTASLIAHWKLDEGWIATVAEEEGNNHDGDINGNPNDEDAGKVGTYCYHFQDDEWVSVTDHDQLDFDDGVDFSIFLWFKYVAGGDRIFLEKINSAGYKMETYHITGQNYGLKATLVIGMTSVSVSGSTHIRDGSWHHLGMVRQGGTLEIWVDGFSDGSVTGAGGDIRNGEELLFGNTEDHSQYNIYLDDVRMYREAVIPAN